MDTTHRKLETRLIHEGEPRPRICGAVSLPIFQSSTYEYHGQSSYDDLRYIRLNNTPNHMALHAKLASLENAEAALVTASGMAAITTALMTVLSAGDHLLAQNCLYGGTHSFITDDFAGLGLSFSFIDGDDTEGWERALRPNTKAIYVETMTNPLLDVADLDAIVSFARAHGLVSIIDNTFATPVGFRPAERGFDLSVHSCTKYLNGHSDIVAGAVIGTGRLVERIRHRLNHLGGSLDPHAAFLLHRGLKTLALRVRCQSESAGRIARFLAEHPGVANVNYPGLETHPRHARARGLFDVFGGMLSFELEGGLEAAKRFISRVKIPIEAPSLGGCESLITRPATTSHSGLTPEARRQMGVSDSLIRLSTGIEAVEDLMDDFGQALE